VEPTETIAFCRAGLHDISPAGPSSANTFFAALLARRTWHEEAGRGNALDLAPASPDT